MTALASDRPYRVSWVDALIARLDAVRGPSWFVYGALALVGILAGNAIGWLNGTPGIVDPYNTVLGVFAILELVLIRRLDQVAAEALVAFRPLLVPDERTYRDLEQRLTTAPRGPAAFYAAIWVAGGLAATAIDPGAHRLTGMTPAGASLVIAIELMINALLAVLILKAARHIRDVAAIHREAPEIDLMNPRPLYAFSELTSQTAIALLFIVAILGLSLAPAYLTGALAATRLAFFVTMSGLVLTATGIFVVPLYDMHRRIVVERDRLQAACGARLSAVLAELDHDVRHLDLGRADGINKLLASVLAERDVLARLPTWPWQAATLRAFVSALLLPVLVYLMARAAERLVL